MSFASRTGREESGWLEPLRWGRRSFFVVCPPAVKRSAWQATKNDGLPRLLHPEPDAPPAARTLFIALCLLLATSLAAQQQQRDLKYEKEPGPAPTPAKVSIPRSYALVVGISNYRNLPPEAQLKFSERDAESIYSILISPEGGNFRAENVHRLIGPRATLAAMRQEIETWLPSVTRDDDRVLIYFAGHGFVFQGKPYLAPYDMDRKDIASTGYPMELLGRSVGSTIKGKWKVLLTDSCHSGAILPESDAQTVNRSLLDLNKSLFSLTASRDREQSFESPDWGGGHGIFTYYVVKGMEGSADENRDGIVTADELSEYVHRNVREATGGKQNPTSERSSFDPNMLLAWVPSNATPGAPPPPKFGDLVFEANMDGVEVLVDGKSAGTVNKAQPLKLPGLAPGVHTVQGVRMGYEPDGPREEVVYPGQTTTVTLKILFPRRRPRAATDSFDRGLEQYNKAKSRDDYRRAASDFRKALEADRNYSQAALYLARCSRDLLDQQQAHQYFRRAIEIDPDYLEARMTYGGMLLDTGETDESIRQLNAVVQRDPRNTQALYMLAQAYRMKDMYRESIEAARGSIRLSPNNAEPHFWLAESLRQSGSYKESAREYGEYLRLSDFDSKLAGKMNYYVLGFIIGGKKKRAGQTDVWKELRSMAYFGLCDAERKMSHWDTAIAYCQKSLAYDPSDPYVHYALGLTYARDAQETGRIELLAAAKKHFRAMLDINPDLAESEYAKKNLVAIDQALKAQ